MFSSFLLIPQLAQTPEATGYGFGMSVTGAGLILAPAALAQLVTGPLAGRFGTRFGFRTVLATGGACVMASFAWLALEHSSVWHLAVAGALLGAGISLALASMANLIVDAVRQTEVGIATGINTVTRTVGGAFGSAVATAIITSEAAAGTPFPTEGAYTMAFVVGAVGGLLALSAALLIPTRRASASDSAGMGEVPAAAPLRG
jgi:MFS family permease